MEKGKGVITFVIFLISIMLVALISIQFRTVEKGNSLGIESMQEEELRTQISEWKSKYEDINEKIETNNNKINEYSNTIQDNKEASELVDKELTEYEMLVGKTNVKGPGVEIVLTDSATKTYTSRSLAYIINELKYAGAEAISINNQRIINNTDIVMIQNRYMLINAERVSAPYTIKAIGNKEKLKEVLTFPKEGLLDSYRNSEYLIDMNFKDEIHIPAYGKQIELKYVEEAK